MLVVLSGVESIHKRLIARQIIAKKNTFVVDGYKLDFTKDNPFGIIGQDGTPVTIESFFPDGLAEADVDARKTTLQKMVELENSIIENGMLSHYFGKFVSICYDLGIGAYGVPVIPWLPENDPIGDTYHYPTSYESVLQRYRESKLDYHVITGSFGKAFIDRIRNDIGAENVIVYNILRNPSVAFSLHTRIPNFTSNQVDMPEQWHMNKLYDSIYNSAILKQDPSIITVRFEDMISTKQFIVDGTNVGLYLDYDAATNWLTRYEAANILPNVPVTEEMVTEFNQSISPCYLVTLGNPIEDGVCKADVSQGTPWNLFEKLGYEPLTLEQIRNS